MRHNIVFLLAFGITVGGPLSRLPAQQPRELPMAAAQPAKLARIAVPAQHAESIATTLSIKYRGTPGITISPDPQRNQLVVMAPAATQQLIAADVQQFLSGAVRPASAIQSGPVQLQLSSISWREFEDSLRQVVGESVPVTTSRNGERASFQLTAFPMADTTVEVDRRENSVTVVAPEPKIPGWRSLIQALDQSTTTGQQVLNLMRLENAEPAPIQRAIRLLGELEQGQDDTVAVAPVQNTGAFRNAVFQSPANQAATQDADVQDVAPAEEGSGAGLIGDTDIQFVPDLGVIIIRGAQRDVDRVREVIQEIERQAVLTQPEVELRQLEYADSNAVAALLQQLYEDVLSARQGEVSITALDTPNALLLIGREEAIKAVLGLIDKIDQPIRDTDRLRVFRLEHASAVDAETTIRDFFADRPGTSEDLRPGLGVRVRVIADYRTNSLIVSASPRDMQEVTRLVNELDVQQIAATNEIKVFRLNNARAEDLAPTIQSAITGEADEDANENVTSPSTTLSIVSVDSEGDQTLDSGILASVVVTADNNANALVVKAPAASMPLIAELIRQLDRAPGIDSLVKVFTIQNGDATQLTAALQSLFGDDAGTAGTSVGAGNLAGLASSTASDSSLVPLRFSTDVRSNSIIVSGSSEDLDVVQSILLRLDGEGFAERITEVIWLKHQAADSVALAIQQYVQERTVSQNIIQQYQTGLGPFDLPDRDLIVVAEPQTNSLLISVSPRLYEDVRRLIDHLDRRPPMVLIKVVIAEVQLDDRFEIGGELGLQDSLLFDRGIASGALPTNFPPSTNQPIGGADVGSLGPILNSSGFNFNNAGTPNINAFGQESLASRGLSTFGVGTTSSVAGVGGFVLSAASESVNVLFRMLQTAGRLQIISRPQIMTMDNNEAIVQVGQIVARPTDVVVTNNNTAIGVADIDVGLILRVQPRVGSDGLIVMTIDATNSAVNNTAPGQVIGSTADGTPVVVPPIDITTAQSVINAYSGQTVVFGGLIQKTRINSSRRVPYLSNIPVLGYLFKFDQESEIRRELLIVMTPMLVTGEQDLDYVKQTESSRMSWCLADVVEAHGDVGLSGGYGLWGPAVGPTIYPDLQPTADDVIRGHRLRREDQPLMLDGESVMIESIPGAGLMNENYIEQAPTVVPVEPVPQPQMYNPEPILEPADEVMMPELGPDTTLWKSPSQASPRTGNTGQVLPASARLPAPSPATIRQPGPTRLPAAATLAPPTHEPGEAIDSSFEFPVSNAAGYSEIKPETSSISPRAWIK